MKFTSVVGKCDPKLVQKAEDKLSAVFVELSLRYDNKSSGSVIGGDPFIFTLAYPVEHICTNSIPTAATDGRRYYWNPEFVDTLSRIGLRFVIVHEAFHAVYMHPARRGSRSAKLWNIAVDYIVNFNVMLDLEARKFDPVKMFKSELGNFIDLKSYADILSGKKQPDEKKSDEKVFFADPKLSEDMRKPEAIYEYLFSQIPKCPKCGKPTPGEAQQQQQSPSKKGKGKQKASGSDGDGDKSESNKGKKGKGKSKNQGQGDCGGHGHDHGDGHSGGQDANGQGGGSDQSGDEDGTQPGKSGGHSCDSHGDFEVYGDLVDDHMDSAGSQEELAKRLADAAEISRRLAGKIPLGMEEELGELFAPKLSWQDFIRMKLQKARAGHGRNDWSKFRSRSMMAGMMVPKRKDYCAIFRCLLDTSGSMSQEDRSFGISQLQALDERGEGTITCADCEIYWDETTKIKKANKDELIKTKVRGGGGTLFGSYFEEYERRLGPADFIIMITDGYLLDEDLLSMKKPKCEVYWVVTSGARFNPPFGRVFDLK